MYFTDGFQYGQVDILPIDPGDYQVILKIDTMMTKSDGIQEKQTRFARANFTRPILDSAHAALEVLNVRPSGEGAVFQWPTLTLITME